MNSTGSLARLDLLHQSAYWGVLVQSGYTFTDFVKRQWAEYVLKRPIWYMEYNVIYFMSLLHLNIKARAGYFISCACAPSCASFTEPLGGGGGREVL